MRCLCRHPIEYHKLRDDGTRGGCSHREIVTGKKCSCKKFQCGHWRIKKNYPFGKKSGARKVCKDCDEMVSNKFLEQRRKNEKVRL